MNDHELFGRFEIRYAQRQLLIDGHPVALGSRAFDVLEALVRRRDRLVTKSELLDLVWPGVVVEDNNLQVQVSTLRKLLGAQVITTIPGRGYRFTPPVEAAAVQGVRSDSEAGTGTRQALTGAVMRHNPTAGSDVGAIRRLLVVDDNKVNRLLLSRSLEQMGHAVAHAENGRRAMEMLRAEPFELLILDLEMPELDGFSVLEQLAADPMLREVPVIVASSVEGVPEIARCIELGADDFLRKPVNPVLLKARVRTSLEKKRLRDQQRDLIRRLATAAVAVDAPTHAPTAEAQCVKATVVAVGLSGLGALVPTLDAAAALELVDSWQTLMLDAVASHHGVVSRAGAEGLLAVFGTPLPAPAPVDSPLAAARAALEMVESLELFNAERQASGGAPLVMGLGLATDDVVAGYTGLPRRAAYACLGPAVDHAERLLAHALAVGQTIVIDGSTQRALAGHVATEPMAPLRGRDPGRGAEADQQVHAIRTA